MGWLDYASPRRNRGDGSRRRTDPLALVPLWLAAAAWAIAAVNRVVTAHPAGHGDVYNSITLFVVALLLQLSGVVCAIVAVAASYSRDLALAGLLVNISGTVLLFFYLTSIFRW